MKAKKVLALVLCAALLVAGSVAATLAYLTATDSVVNSFTYGKVEMTLDEAPVDLYGEVVEGDRCDKNDYKLIPSHEYKKDPTVHMVAGSEESYVFVKVENGIEAIEIAEKDGDTIKEQMIANGWEPLTGVANVWVYNTTVKPAADEDMDLVVFEKFTLADNADVAQYGAAKITVTAYAIQADGFNGAQDAWNNSGFGA